MHDIILADSEEDYKAAALLFHEYAKQLGIDLSFQNFNKEMEILNIMYAPPSGRIILYKDGTGVVACVGIRKFKEDTAEIKRMYVQPEQRNKGIADKLMREAISVARHLKYKKILLDTLNNMTAAIRLYKRYGFKEIEPYYYNPQPTAVFFRLDL